MVCLLHLLQTEETSEHVTETRTQQHAEPAESTSPDTLTEEAASGVSVLFINYVINL